MNAINAGLNVIFQTDYNHSKLFMPHFLDGKIDTNRINDAVSRVLSAKFELGLFDHPYTSEKDAKNIMHDSSGKKIGKQAAFESIVLLKNDEKILPLKNIHSIAVIGEDATAARFGSYSGPGNNVVNILDGIKKRAGNNIHVSYAEGADILSSDWKIIPAKYLSNNNVEGLKAEYFGNITLSGDADVTRIDTSINFQWTLSSPEFFEPNGNAHLHLIWNVDVENNWQQKINEAVVAAKKSDVAVVTVGIDEDEFQDRAMLSLPGHQEALIKAIAATHKPVVVLLVGGSAITMNNWFDSVHAVLDVWYPGEQGGNAVADILFGYYNPAGRLPITFPINEAQLPLYIIINQLVAVMIIIISVVCRYFLLVLD